MDAFIIQAFNALSLASILILVSLGLAIIFGMLFAMALAAALFAGYGMGGAKRRNWVHMIGFSAVMAGSVNVIVDLEYPRLGLIRVDAFDQALVDLRKSMD